MNMWHADGISAGYQHATRSDIDNSQSINRRGCSTIAHRYNSQRRQLANHQPQVFSCSDKNRLSLALGQTPGSDMPAFSRMNHSLVRDDIQRSDPLIEPSSDNEWTFGGIGQREFAHVVDA